MNSLRDMQQSFNKRGGRYILLRCLKEFVNRDVANLTGLVGENAMAAARMQFGMVY